MVMLIHVMHAIQRAKFLIASDSEALGDRKYWFGGHNETIIHFRTI